MGNANGVMVRDYQIRYKNIILIMKVLLNNAIGQFAKSTLALPNQCFAFGPERITGGK